MRELTVLPVLKIQSVLLNHLNVALKFSSINVFVFFTMIHSIEAKVAAKLLNKGGIFKFIYQTSDKKWFTINYSKGKFKFFQLMNGIWKFSDILFRFDEDGI